MLKALVCFNSLKVRRFSSHWVSNWLNLHPYNADPVAPCGHDFSAKDGLMGQTPLHAAAENGFHEIVVLLVVRPFGVL